MKAEITFNSVRDFIKYCFDNQPKEPVVWYTTLNRIKFVCRMNGLTIKQAGRIVRKVAAGRMTANQVLDHLDQRRKAWFRND